MMKNVLLATALLATCTATSLFSQTDGCSPSNVKGVHVVQKKETLFAVSRKYKVTVPQLCAWNNISPNDILPECAQLYVVAPNNNSKKEAPAPVMSQSYGGANTTGTLRHIVKKGENLTDIAAKYGFSIERILAMNKIPYGDPVYVGQELIVEDCNCPEGNSAVPTPSATPKNGRWADAEIKEDVEPESYYRPAQYNDERQRRALPLETAPLDPIAPSDFTDDDAQALIRRYGNANSRYETVIHNVTKGDTPEILAQLYGMEADEIMDMNDLVRNASLKSGQRLVVEYRKAHQSEADYRSETRTEYRSSKPVETKEDWRETRPEDRTAQKSEIKEDWKETRYEDERPTESTAKEGSGSYWYNKQRPNNTKPTAPTTPSSTTKKKETKREEPAPTDNSTGMSREEMDMLREINLLRTNPEGYIPYIEAYMLKLKSASNKAEIAAAKELIAELRKTPKLAAIEPSPCIYSAAKKHGVELRKRNETEHQGLDGSWPWDRITRECKQMTDGNENLVGGPVDIREAVILLAVDYGIDSRGHRKTLLNPSWRYGACYKIGTVNKMPNCWVQNFGY